MRYLLHNIYGDADDLIASAPDDVISVPFGWDAATEAARNDLLAQLGLSGVSGLPCLLYQDGGRWVQFVWSDPAAGWDAPSPYPDTVMPDGMV